MVSKAMMTGVVSAGTIALFTWLGGFVQGIFQDTATLMEQISNGHTPTNISIISDADMNKLENFGNEVAKMEGLEGISK